MEHRTAFLLATTLIVNSLSLSAMQKDSSSSMSLAFINGIAFSGSATDLQKACKKHGNVINQESFCHEGCFLTYSEPKILNTLNARPLYWATLSQHEPIEKISYLKSLGAHLSAEDIPRGTHPFFAALTRHKKERSTLSRNIVAAILTHYPEIYSQQDSLGRLPLHNIAELIEPKLLAHILAKTAPDQKELIKALEIIKVKISPSLFPSWVYCIITFFATNDFKADQKACEALLEQALGYDKKKD